MTTEGMRKFEKPIAVRLSLKGKNRGGHRALIVGVSPAKKAGELIVHLGANVPIVRMNLGMRSTSTLLQEKNGKLFTLRLKGDKPSRAHIHVFFPGGARIRHSLAAVY